jgi:integrase
VWREAAPNGGDWLKRWWTGRRLLIEGRSPAPRAVGDLLLALSTAGAGSISPPWCAGCGRAVTSMQRRGEDWYCSPCFARPEACAACGQQRHVTFRDRHGRPRCSQCPDHDDRDPHRVLIEVITSLAPGLRTDAITTAITATVIKPAHEHKLAWAIEQNPGLLTGDGAKAPFPMVLRLIDALCAAGATHIRRPACPRCARLVVLSKLRDGLRVCRNCAAKANAVPCTRCATVREPAARDEQGKPLCPNCLVSDPINLEECVGCRRRRRVNTRTPHGPLCASCVPRRTAICSVCGRTVLCMVSKITGQPWCGACANTRAQCSRCGQRAAIRAGTREAPLCAGCAVPNPGFWRTCPSCGTSGRLIAGACSRCHLHQRLAELLADTSGQTRPELQILHQTLATVERPATVLNWLKRPTVCSVLAELATGQRPLGHATLDDLPPGKPVEHLRSVLVATEALPARDEQLARIERWVVQTVHDRSDLKDKELLHRYAVWHLLRRLRQRNRDAEATYGQLDVVRQRVRAAIGLLDWLRARGMTLATCRQADLDLWMTSNDASPRFGVGHFVRWAISQNINRNLRFAATRWTGPAHPLDHDERWQQAKRLLHDDTIDADDRVAGLLLLLYAQRPAVISRLTIDDIDTIDDTVRVCFGSVPIALPEPLATLTCDLVATRRGHAVLGDRGTSPWLFPGGQPGRPVSADRLGQRLRQLGLRPAKARSTALFQLATELPAAVLARMLGIHIKVAVAWQHVCAGDWTNYAADVALRPQKETS